VAAEVATVSKRSTIPWRIALALFAVTVAIFWPALQNDFVNWDDDLNLVDNAAFRGFSLRHLEWMLTTTLGGHYQPLSWLSFALDHALWGMDPWGYHLTALVLHGANAVVCFLVLRALLSPLDLAPPAMLNRAAAVGALVFAIHPLRVESVAWATERRDVLSGLFWLLGLLAYLASVHGPPARRVVRRRAALAALALSLLAKAWGITFPVVLLILDVYPLRRVTGARSSALREKIPFALIAAAGAGLAFAAQAGVPEHRSLAEHGLFARVAQAAYGLCFYVGATLWPAGLHPAYLLETGLDPTRPRYLLAMGLVAAITALAVLGRRRWPWLAATWASYVVIVGPVLGFAQTGPQLVADRYTYLACLPWVALLTAGLARLWAPQRPPLLRRAGAVATIATLALLAILTGRQIAIWRDSTTLWNHVLRLDPTNYIAWSNRAWVQPDPAVAIADYSEAIRLNPRYHRAYFNRGNVRQDVGDYAGAEADHAMAIQIRPTDPDAYNNRGWARQALGDWRGAAADYARALELAPADWVHRDLVAGNLAAARARITANGG
jgi:protein O-mannosyl-transferase